MADDYFVRRALPAEASYEESYWGVITDPDGQVRDRRLERAQHLDDLKTELAFIHSLPPGKLLDVGCGLGFLLSGVEHGWERHGVEVSSFAAQSAGQYGCIFNGALEDANYADQQFDVVVLYHVIEHVADPLALLKELRRVLKDDGWLILGTPDFDSGAARLFGEKYRLLHDVTHISLFSNDSMHRFLRDHGFAINRVDYPYFETRHFNEKSLLGLFDRSTISPPFYGNFMTFYCRKEPMHLLKEQVASLSNFISDEAATLLEFQQTLASALSVSLGEGRSLTVQADATLLAAAMHLVSLLGARLGEPSRVRLLARDGTPCVRHDDPGTEPAAVQLDMAWAEPEDTRHLVFSITGLQEPWRKVLPCSQANLLLPLIFETVMTLIDWRVNP